MSPLIIILRCHSQLTTPKLALFAKHGESVSQTLTFSPPLKTTSIQNSRAVPLLPQCSRRQTWRGALAHRSSTRTATASPSRARCPGRTPPKSTASSSPPSWTACANARRRGASSPNPSFRTSTSMSCRQFLNLLEGTTSVRRG